jgi:tetratricopeptide (TPR) repeat protein
MHAARSVKNMCRQYAKRSEALGLPSALGAQAWAFSVTSHRVSHCAMLALSVFLLVACGSTPTPSTSSSPTTREDAEELQESGAGAAEQPLPPEAVKQFDAAVVHMNAGDAAAAEQGFRALAAAYPSYSGPLVNLGIIEAKAGRLQEAEKTLTSAISRNARNAAAFNQLGIVYRKMGRFQDAEKAYQQGVQADPNYANTYLNLGVLCDLYLQQPDRALEAYERYLELAPTPDARVGAWVTELRKRIGSEPRAARSE